MTNDQIVFDSESGISVEEQKEILAQINGIAERNRQRLAQSARAQKAQSVTQNASGVQKSVQAKKNSALFPIVVNAAALFILCVGGLSLILFNGKKDAQVREGAAVYDVTERALIEEIRKDTSEKIAEKEEEITSITTRLEDVDSQLEELYSSHQELTAEQIATQDRLLALQTAYREDLAALLEEKSQILEDARSREARLRALLEERAREFAAAQQLTSGELDSAREELNRLTSEQEKSSAIDAQLAGGLAAIGELLQNGDYDQAEQAAANLRQLNNSSMFSTARSFQTRREFYNKSIDAIDTMISHIRMSGGADAAKEQWNLQVKNSQLEERIAEMQKTLEAASSGSSGLMTRLTEMESSIKDLRAEKTSLEATVADKDKAISNLEDDKTSLNVTVMELREVRDTQEQEISNLRSRLSNVMQVLQE